MHALLRAAPAPLLDVRAVFVFLRVFSPHFLVLMVHFWTSDRKAGHVPIPKYLIKLLHTNSIQLVVPMLSLVGRSNKVNKFIPLNFEHATSKRSSRHSLCIPQPRLPIEEALPSTQHFTLTRTGTWCRWRWPRRRHREQPCTVRWRA